MNAQVIPFPNCRRDGTPAARGHNDGFVTRPPPSSLPGTDPSPYVLEHVESGQEFAEADSMDEAREKAINLYRGLGLQRVVIRARWSGAVTELVIM